MAILNGSSDRSGVGASTISWSWVKPPCAHPEGVTLLSMDATSWLDAEAVSDWLRSLIGMCFAILKNFVRTGCNRADWKEGDNGNELRYRMCRWRIALGWHLEDRLKRDQSFSLRTSSLRRRSTAAREKVRRDGLCGRRQ